MTRHPDNGPSQKSPSNLRVAVLCGCLVTVMVGLAYASVPLYRIFCQVTGFGGTTQRADAPAERILDRKITVQFDANTGNNLAWKFKPAQREVSLKIGEQALAFYRAENQSKTSTTGTATFNVSPASAGAYFAKVECFCFTEQTLKAGQSVDMPVMFYIDPDIDKDEDLKKLKVITLSYTFYAVDKPKQTTGKLPDASGTLLNTIAPRLAALEDQRE